VTYWKNLKRSNKPKPRVNPKVHERKPRSRASRASYRN
jgi:hypothetical protein